MNENLKATWSYYLMFLIGLGMVWLSANKLSGLAADILVAAGALLMFGGGLLLMLWTRKKAKQDKENENKK